MNTPDKPATVRDSKAIRARFFVLIAAGLTSQEAAKEVGVSDRSRTRFLQERRKAGQPVERPIPLDDIRKFADNGHRIEDVATRFNVPQTKMREFAEKHGIVFTVPERPKQQKHSDINLAEVVRLAGEGLSKAGIATQMNVDRHRMRDFIHANNIEITWGLTRPRKPDRYQERREAEDRQRQEYNTLIATVQTMLFEGKKIEQVAKELDKSYDIIYRLVRNNDLRQPVKPDFVVPIALRSTKVTHAVGRVLVQTNSSEAGDRPCITCHEVFRSWHKRNNQRCERCRARDD